MYTVLHRSSWQGSENVRGFDFCQQVSTDLIFVCERQQI
jgi:hypothetical protein